MAWLMSATTAIAISISEEAASEILLFHVSYRYLFNTAVDIRLEAGSDEHH
jgi:hypothetical protein